TTELGDEVQAAPDGLADPVEGVAAGDVRRVEDHRGGHVHVVRRGLEVEEHRVESAQAFHAPLFMSSSLGWRRPATDSHASTRAGTKRRWPSTQAAWLAWTGCRVAPSMARASFSCRAGEMKRSAVVT